MIINIKNPLVEEGVCMNIKTKKEKSQIALNFEHYMKSVRKQAEKIDDDHDCKLSDEHGCEVCERRYL